MSEPSPNPQRKAGNGIELEPLAPPDASAGSEVRAAEPEGDQPIPQRPLHLCPNCDYNLTGLISRRCPECGEPFTIADARAHGFELSEEGQDFRRWMRADRAISVLGVAMLVFGLVCPCVWYDAVAGKWQFALTLKTWGMWLVLVPLVGLLLLINLYHEQSRSRVLLEIGIFVTIVGLVVALI